MDLHHRKAPASADVRESAGRAEMLRDHLLDDPVGLEDPVGPVSQRLPNGRGRQVTGHGLRESGDVLRHLAGDRQNLGEKRRLVAGLPLGGVRRFKFGEAGLDRGVQPR